MCIVIVIIVWVGFLLNRIYSIFEWRYVRYTHLEVQVKFQRVNWAYCGFHTESFRVWGVLKFIKELQLIVVVVETISINNWSTHFNWFESDGLSLWTSIICYETWKYVFTHKNGIVPVLDFLWVSIFLVAIKRWSIQLVWLTSTFNQVDSFQKFIFPRKNGKCVFHKHVST